MRRLCLPLSSALGVSVLSVSVGSLIEPIIEFIVELVLRITVKFVSRVFVTENVAEWGLAEWIIIIFILVALLYGIYVLFNRRLQR